MRADTTDLPPWMSPLKRAVRSMCRELGSQRRLADVLGVSDTLVQAWHSLDVRKPMGWQHALDERLQTHLPAEARAAFWRELAGPGLAVISTRSASYVAGRAADLTLASATVRSSAELAARVLDAVSDGKITRLEGEHIIAAVDDLLGLLLAIRERASHAVRDEVVAEVVEIRRAG